MRSRPAVLTLSLLAACGGGGGGGGTPPATLPLRLTAEPLVFPAGTSSAELVVSLDAPASAGAVLAEVAIELPPGLAIAAGSPLRAAQPLVSLDGHGTGTRYQVLVGDARNASGQLLPRGALFRLQLVTSAPRQSGTSTVRLTGTRIAASDGSAVAVDSDPVEVPVSIL